MTIPDNPSLRRNHILQRRLWINSINLTITRASHAQRDRRLERFGTFDPPLEIFRDYALVAFPVPFTNRVGAPFAHCALHGLVVRGRDHDAVCICDFVVPGVVGEEGLSWLGEAGPHCWPEEIGLNRQLIFLNLDEILAYLQP